MLMIIFAEPKFLNYLLVTFALLFSVVQGIKYSEEALLDQINELPGLDYSIGFN